MCPPFLSGVECRPGKYRRVDGLCNNLENPTWGAAHTVCKIIEALLNIEIEIFYKFSKLFIECFSIFQKSIIPQVLTANSIFVPIKINFAFTSNSQPFQRLIGPLYSDSISSPRISVTGHDLPLSRVVSRTIHPDEGYHDHAGTVMIVAWGQFMDHDLTLTATPLGKLPHSLFDSLFFS